MKTAISNAWKALYNIVALFMLNCSVFVLFQVFSLTVFASLVNEGYQNLVTSSELHCVLNENDAACCYGITVGAISFFQSLLFLGFDIFDSTITSYKFKYAILVLDFTFSGKYSSFLTDQLNDNFSICSCCWWGLNTVARFSVTNLASSHIFTPKPITEPVPI